MALLDLQNMDTPEHEGHGGGSELSLLLCDSVASVSLCV
ncbi:SapB/AmfS family lanthipeptide [Streptantibioticus rubrisoli]|uniref:SapB/AmfS family lanthipeptide n=1 Tax=Streptantibioticus rubrisoli TaxID=1387313 RepID=A0ABT1PM18_9ACTN|nr:SapB/AmfS family lanthipeptide [Streptantibioticus rubrisoli]MCQ4046406.1 SapB/AmfS family lanthipeptide [Streptantibioticus rubrisoli]